MDKPLITKYRPVSLKDVVGHGHCVSRLKQRVEEYQVGRYSKIPHLMFTGAPGIGKTTIAQAFCQDLYGPQWKSYVLLMNASDERGIDVIRGRIKKFAEARPNVEGFNVIILDEADNLTPDAQAALRMTMELNSEQCRFIICANYSNKLIEPLKDRCALYRFKPLEDGQVTAVVSKVAKAEGIDLKGAESRIAQFAKGSVRRALNLLAQLPNAPTDEDIKAIAPTLDKSIVNNALKSAFAGDIESAERGVMQCVWDGHEPGEILEELFDQIMASQLNRKTKLTITADIAEAEYRMLFGCNPKIQLRSLLSRLAMMAGDK